MSKYYLIDKETGEVKKEFEYLDIDLALSARDLFNAVISNSYVVVNSNGQIIDTY